METVTTSPMDAPEGASPETVFVERLKAFRAGVDERLEAFLDAKRPAAEGSLRALTEAVADLVLAGGKRLRPALVHETYRALGGDDERAVLPMALATELLQAYLLIHDDIMDHAELRRGRPTVHARFRQAHARERQLEWPGEAQDFGRSMAILAGDLAHTWAVELYQQGRHHASRADGLGLDRCFSSMCEEVVGGQFLEMSLPGKATEGEPTEEELSRVLRLKSGRYSVERPLELGARLAGAEPEVLLHLSHFGAAAGEAFQLRDDVIGVFGDPEDAGKSTASDLVEGKHTFLIHYAFAQAEDVDVARLQAGLGRDDLDADEIEILRIVLRRSGALDRVLQRIEARLDEARQALSELPFEGRDREFYLGMIDYLKERTR